MAKIKTIDLFSGIGGIRQAFEKTGHYKNVLSCENDKFACETYKHLFNENPFGDITDVNFQEKIKSTNFDLLMAGFPCQSFSFAGKKEAFSDKTRGTMFFELVKIIKDNTPEMLFLENVSNILRIQKGKVFETILKTLTFELGYFIYGVEVNGKEIVFDKNTFLFDAKNFGLPQKRNRVFIVASKNKSFISNLTLIYKNEEIIWKNVEDASDDKVDPKFLLSKRYLNTLKKHKERHKAKGNGYGYVVVNKTKEKIANTLLATGGSGKERNLIFDPNLLGDNYEGKNNEGIRNMTPNEWSKLQGFKGYGFLKKAEDKFSFPETISNTQRYKQLGNSVAIPVVESQADAIAKAYYKTKKEEE
jgi:DNA (cytosine-5)-methyltransferase 1